MKDGYYRCLGAFGTSHYVCSGKYYLRGNKIKQLRGIDGSNCWGGPLDVETLENLVKEKLMQYHEKRFDWRWFNISSSWIGPVRLWNCFNRFAKEGHMWGFGLLQIAKIQRSLFYIGHAGISILFIGKMF